MSSLISIGGLKVYRKYKGDIDAFTRFANRSDRATISSGLFRRLENHLSNLKLIQQGLASEEFSRAAIDEVRKDCDSETYEELMRAFEIEDR